jgi:hypothetical protein
MNQNLLGMRYEVSQYICKTVTSFSPRRRHRKKRIAKKWLNKYGLSYTVIPCNGVAYQVGGITGGLFCCPCVMRAIEKQVKQSA